MAHYILSLCLLLLGVPQQHTTTRDQASRARFGQSFESRDSIFFTNYPNPMSDFMQFLSFYNETGQDVEIRITDTKDSVIHKWTITGNVVGEYYLYFRIRDKKGYAPNINNEIGIATIFIANRKKCSVRTIIWSPGKYEVKMVPVTGDN